MGGSGEDVNELGFLKRERGVSFVHWNKGEFCLNGNARILFFAQKPWCE